MAPLLAGVGVVRSPNYPQSVRGDTVREYYLLIENSENRCSAMDLGH